VRRPVSTWAIADQLNPEWYARASRVHPRRSLAARTRLPIPGSFALFFGTKFPNTRG